MKQIMKKIIIGIIIMYIVIIIAYVIGKLMGNNMGLEYRTWVEQAFWMISRWVPIILVIIIFFIYTDMYPILIVIPMFILPFVFFFWYLFGTFGIHEDKVMPDGNLVVTEYTSFHHSNCYFAEPVGPFHRRVFEFDNERRADSLSEMYDLDFNVYEKDNGEIVYISTEYPDIEVKIVKEGKDNHAYLENYFEYMLTSKMLYKHKNIFDKYNIKLVPYEYKSYWEQELLGVYYGILITDENKENAANAIAEFIKTTLKEDKKANGESCWKAVEGSIFLLQEDLTTGEIFFMRNMPFSLKTSNYRTYNKRVTGHVILEDLK